MYSLEVHLLDVITMSAPHPVDGRPVHWIKPIPKNTVINSLDEKEKPQHMYMHMHGYIRYMYTSVFVLEDVPSEPTTFIIIPGRHRWLMIMLYLSDYNS